MKKLTCPFCKNDKEFTVISIEEKSVYANLCMKCGRVWIDDSKDEEIVYNISETINEAPLTDDKE